ncbi:phosphate ABC transporter substrate-binding protein PstS [Serinibacter arcticus]|uniref:Phosphate-binding protein n=1 Tax=Serinibacter arcticus TaxID=1655435 RepID=A0A2U2A035_9MICO|nr:phosphate ABC transporter substrate-binding protein PstS [Serinibacter arcticus]
MSIRRGVTTAIAASTVLVLAACGGGSSDPETTDGGSESSSTSEGGADLADLSGTLAGAGASSQENAMNGWLAGFQEQAPGVQPSYDAVGSSGGREQFLSGGVQFAGSDSPLKEEEIATAQEMCTEPLELPLYISPIAVVYNLPDVDADNINLDSDTIAKMFAGEITSWDDEAIAAQNEGVELPAVDIIPVNRADGSGTTENFQEYLVATAPDSWPYEASDTWPVSGGQSGNGTSGMISTVESTEGTIGYADASRAGDLGTVALKVGEEYVPFSPEAAATAVDASPLTEDATDLRITYELDRTTTEAGAYPLVLISYSLACQTYENASDAANVKAFLSYVASPEGQDRAAMPDVAGSAPISEDLRTDILAAIDQIS